MKPLQIESGQTGQVLECRHSLSRALDTPSAAPTGAELAKEHLRKLREAFEKAFLDFKQILVERGSSKWIDINLQAVSLEGHLNTIKNLPELNINFSRTPRLNKQQSRLFEELIRQHINKAGLEGSSEYLIWLRILP